MVLADRTAPTGRAMARFLSRRMRVLLLLAVLWAMSTIFWRSYRTPELEAHKLKVQQKTEEMNALLSKLNAVCLVPRRPSLPSCSAACAYLPHLPHVCVARLSDEHVSQETRGVARAFRSRRRWWT